MAQIFKRHMHSKINVLWANNRGPGKTVKINESQFYIRKNHPGKILPNQLAFGGIEFDTNNLFMEPVANRFRETLFENIRRRIRLVH